jgi:hypothetical protein
MIHDDLFKSRDFDISVHLAERDFPVVRSKKVSLNAPLLRRNGFELFAVICMQRVRPTAEVLSEEMTGRIATI